MEDAVKLPDEGAHRSEVEDSIRKLEEMLDGDVVDDELRKMVEYMLDANREFLAKLDTPHIFRS